MKTRFAALMALIALGCVSYAQTSGTSNLPEYTTTQTISDFAQQTTLAFAGLGVMTGNLDSQSFFPPGKVADYTGFQYLRDNDPDNMGHNTSFLTRIANNVLYILNDSQLSQLKTLAAAQQSQIDLYGYKRFALMEAFRRLMDGDSPSGSAGLSFDAVMQASHDLYLIDGQISFDRALLYANIYSSMDSTQTAYLNAMKGKGWSSWPDITNAQVAAKTQGLSQNAAVAVMTYASDLFSWYSGSVDADVYFCPERHGTYFGSFYIKDAPAVGHEGYSISEQLTATAGAALCDSSKGYVTADQAAAISSLVDIQRNNLYAGATSIVGIRTQIATLLRSLLVSTGSSSTVNSQVLALSGTYGDLDGEDNYHYATVYAQVYKTMSAAQKTSLTVLRKAIMSGTYSDGTAFDFSVCTTPFLYSGAITGTSVLAPYIADTDYLFLPASAPVVTTGTAGETTDNTSTLTGTVNPNGSPTMLCFQYGLTAGYGFVTGTQTAGSGTDAVPFSVNIGSLNPGTTYHFQLVASNTGGTVFGLDQTLTTTSSTLALKPTVTGGRVSVPGQSIVTAAASVVPNWLATTVRFDYGRTTGYGFHTANANLPAGGSVSSVSMRLAGLAPHTTYHLRCVAQNALGITYSADLPFRTLSRNDFNRDGFADLVTVNPRTHVTNIFYTRNGSAVGAPATGPSLPTTFSLRGVADVDGDGNSDWLLYDSAKKRVTAWLMNGAQKVKTVLGHTISAEYEVAAFADLNADGKPDLVLYNKTTRRAVFWIMDGMTVTKSIIGPLLPVGFAIIGVDDLTGDKKPDLLLWNSATGQTLIEVLSGQFGTTLISSLSGPPISSPWRLMGVDAFNSDDTADWFLFNPGTGATQIWKMTGAKKISSMTGPRIPAGQVLLGPR